LQILNLRILIELVRTLFRGSSL